MTAMRTSGYSSQAVAAPDQPGRPLAEMLRDRLIPPMPPASVWGWVGPLLVTLFGGFLRFYRLGIPHTVVFDEIYYVPDAYGILRHGVEMNHVKNVKALLTHGSTHILSTGSGFGGEYVVHPPFGKVLIAVGEWMFGLTPFGWRFAVAAVGTLSILMVARIARRMTRSTLLGCVAGLLMSLDGLELVLSRTAILDIFLMFWVLAAFGMLVLDRDASRARLADLAAAAAEQGSATSQGATGRNAVGGLWAFGRRAARHPAPSSQDAAVQDTAGQDTAGRDTAGQVTAGQDTAGHDAAADRGSAVRRGSADAVGGPKLGIRWRRVLAGVFLGLACASKWNGVWFIFAFAGLAIAWDFGARRALGYRDRIRSVLRSDVKWLPVTFGLAPLAAYTAAWSGWFASSVGYDRNWAALYGNNHTPIWSTVDSWYQYQKSMLGFGLGLSSNSGYTSRPWTWLAVARPVSMFYATPKTCGVGSCSQEVLAIGTPAIWWASMLALLFCLGWWISRRDWRAGAVLLAVGAGWLPWFWFALHDNRTEYYFYAVAFLPYLVIAVTLCLGLIIGPEQATPGRRAAGAVVAGGYLLLVLANFAFMYPVLAAEVIPYTAWHQRMWFSSWI